MTKNILSKIPLLPISALQNLYIHDPWNLYITMDLIIDMFNMFEIFSLFLKIKINSKKNRSNGPVLI